MATLRMSWPNRITLARILLIVPFVIVMLHVNDPDYTPWARYGALLIFLIMAISDALDGYLARRYHDITGLGTFLDPLADKLLITCACLLLAAPQTAIPHVMLPDVVVVIIIGKDLYTILGFLIVYFITGRIKITPAASGKLSTLLQLSMVLAVLIAPEMIRWFGGYRYFVQTLWWAASASAVLTVIQYTRQGSRFMGEFEQQQAQAKAAPADAEAGGRRPGSES
ncbi:MAG: CDP-alcohol phosphatidyltransferase family protein [Sedimentisphaerales bacterium]|nr:CDP-alcohol phosphatidyltransferase family protein [Sedimentisphaerales bacterium]